MNWRLSRDAYGRPAIETIRDGDVAWRTGSVMRELARTNPELVEVSDGRWMARKTRAIHEV